MVKTGPDVLVWVKMMAWDLSANYSSELLKHDLRARVGGQDGGGALGGVDDAVGCRTS